MATKFEPRPLSRRRALAVGAALTFAGASAPALARAAAATTGENDHMIPIGPDGLHGFAFQTGTWRVQHRKLKRRLAGEKAWWEFVGSCRAFEVMDGAGNVDDHLIPDPNGSYRAATLRTLDRKTGTWTIYWSDQRVTDLAPALRGRFENGVGLFHGDDEFEGKPIQVRFIWNEIGPDHARWEQAFSPDKGKTWEVNWVMNFERTSANP